VGVLTTAKGSDIFVHLFDLPGADLRIGGAALPKISSVNLLATGESLKFQQENGFTIKLPAQAPDPDVTVIRLRTV
jgi:hypothetical protein